MIIPEISVEFLLEQNRCNKLYNSAMTGQWKPLKKIEKFDMSWKSSIPVLKNRQKHDAGIQFIVFYPSFPDNSSDIQCTLFRTRNILQFVCLE